MRASANHPQVGSSNSTKKTLAGRSHSKATSRFCSTEPVHLHVQVGCGKSRSYRKEVCLPTELIPDTLIGDECFGLGVFSAFNSKYRRAVDFDRKDRERKRVVHLPFAFRPRGAGRKPVPCKASICERNLPISRRDTLTVRTWRKLARGASSFAAISVSSCSFVALIITPPGLPSTGL